MKEIPYLEPITVQVQLPQGFRPNRAQMKASRKSSFEMACWYLQRSVDYQNKANELFLRANEVQKQLEASKP